MIKIETIFGSFHIFISRFIIQILYILCLVGVEYCVAIV